jgi:hypothetical protein
MAQNIVDVSWDLAKFDEQTQAVLANMTKVYDLANQAKATGIKLGSDGGFTELKKNVVEFNKVQENTIRLTKLQESAEQARLKTQIAAAKAAKEQEAAEQQRLKTQAQQLELTKKQAAANEKAAKAYNPTNVPFVVNPVNNDELKNATTLVNEVNQAEAAAAISAAELGNSVNKSTTAISEQGIVSKKVNSESIRDKEIQKQLERQANQELKNSVREQLAAKGSLEQRRAALIRLNAAYDNLNVAERNSQYGIRLQSTIAGVTTQVKELEAATGRAQRNVGNYGSAFSKVAKGATTAYNGLRKIAYLIPGIGIGGLVLILIEPITKLLNLLTKSTSATVTLAEKTRILGEVQQESVRGYGSAAAKIELLKSKLDDLTISESDRLKYAKEYNDVADEGNKIDTAQLNNISLINSQMEAQIELLKQRALALGATNVLAKKAEDVFNAQLTLSNDQAQFVDTDKLKKTLDNAQRILDNAAKKRGETNKLSAKEALAFIDLPDDQLQQVIKKNQNKFKILEDASVRDQLQELATRAKNIKEGYAAIGSAGVGILKSDTDDLQDAQREFDKALKVIGPLINTDTFSKKGKERGVSKAIMDSTKESLDAEFELYKIAQQRKIKLLDEEQNDNKKAWQERIIAAGEFQKATIELSDKTYQHEIDNDKKKLEVLKENYKKAKGTEKNNIAVEIENATKEIIIAQAKQQDARIDLEKSFKTQYEKIAKETEADRLKTLEEAEKSVKNVRQNQQGAIDAAQATEIGSLDKLLSEKLISQEEYNKRKAKFENDALILSLQSQIKEAEGLKAIAKLKGESVIDFDNKITELTGKLQSAQSGKKDPKDDSGLNKRQEIVKDAQLITQTIDSLVDIGYQKEIDAIQRIIDLNEERKNREIANINASTLSNQEKAAQMMILDNTVAANNKKLKREQVALQIKQAKFDRDMAVLQILENVAAANFKLIAQGGFAGIAAGISVGLEALAAVAQLVAKPLPQMPAYAEGTDNHPGGDAIVGEGKFKELVTEPSGKSFIASRPMLMHNLPKGSKVTPLKENMDMINQDLYNSMVIGTVQRIQAAEMVAHKNSNKDIVDAIELGSIRTVQAMKKQKGSHVTVNIDGNWGAYISKVVKE